MQPWVFIVNFHKLHSNPIKAPTRNMFMFSSITGAQAWLSRSSKNCFNKYWICLSWVWEPPLVPLWKRMGWWEMTEEKQVKTHHETSIFEQMLSTNQTEAEDILPLFFYNIRKQQTFFMSSGQRSLQTGLCHVRMGVATRSLKEFPQTTPCTATAFLTSVFDY